MSSKESVKKLLKNWEISPSKKLGQNFLWDQKALNKIVKAGNIAKNDIILEIGAGTGNLTEELRKKGKKVIAVEKDKKLASLLKKKFASFPNVQIVQGDILKVLREEEPKLNYSKVIANIPYYITSPLLRILLKKKDWELIVLTLQKELGERILAKPPKTNFLALFLQFYGKGEIVAFVPRESFWPKPKVDSAILKIKPRKKRAAREEKVFNLIRKGFSHPRKQLLNNLAQELKADKMKLKKELLRAKINPSQRAENLKLREWIKLSKKLLK